MPLPKQLLLASTFIVALSCAAQEGEKPTADAKPAKTKSKAKAEEVAAETSGGMGALGALIPQGVRNKNVQIPGFKDGRPSSMITAKAVTRQSDSELFAEDMIIKLFGSEEKDNVRVDLNTAIYEMNTKVLRSNERSRVSRTDFHIEGDTLEFDTTTSQGRMKGRVRMVIYDTTQLSQKNKTTTPPPASTAAPVTPEPASEPAPVAPNPTPPSVKGG
ncbi:MAG: hypothetical protein JNJ83_24550 [Verrucomicrobiaceae bacterium]|nr:hypothetical protein [Verrucomicrobiaceae bacterium]